MAETISELFLGQSWLALACVCAVTTVVAWRSAKLDDAGISLHSLSLLSTGLLITLLIAIAGWWVAKDMSITEENELARRQLNEIASELNREGLIKSDLAVTSLSMQPSIIESAAQENLLDTKESIAALETVKDLLDASLVYVLNKDGTVVASTPYGDGQTITGNNYAFRPYFKRCIETDTKQIYPALGVTTRKRGVYFSAPVHDNGEVVGVVVIKTGVDAIEATLAESESPCALISNDGIVFCSNREDWHFKAAHPLDVTARRRLLQSQQFADMPLEPLGLNLRTEEPVTLDGSEHMLAQRNALIPGWRVVLLYPTPRVTAKNLAITIGGGISAFWALFALGVVATANKRHREHKRLAEESLRESELKLRLLFERSMDAIVVINGYDFIEYNSAALEILQLDSVPTCPLHPWEISPPLQPDGRLSSEKAKEMIDIARARGGHRFEWVHRRMDGTKFAADVTLTPIPVGDGQMIYTAWRDITEQKQNEESLRQSNRELQQHKNELETRQRELATANEKLRQHAGALEDANKKLDALNRLAQSATQAKSEFLANMSHEIRTPITAILGYGDLIMDETVENKTKEYVTVIQRNGQHLLGVINDILDLSKVEAGQMRIEAMPCDPTQLLKDVLSLMKVRAEEKNLEIHINPPIGDIPPTITTDPLRLRQILVNILGNAIKFTQEGEIRLTISHISTPSGPKLSYTVTDTGIGMAEEQIDKLFQPFNQVDASAARKFGGTGLGLCISKRLAEALGGTINVQSQIGRGSIFEVTVAAPQPDIPLRPNGDTANEAENSANGGPSYFTDLSFSGRILLAEDGVDNQRLIAHLLKKAGAEVLVVENGQLAVTAVEEAMQQDATPFDLILMDMQMPIMDGYAATRALRKRGYEGPIIALTAHAMPEDRARCMEAGCDEYLSKPIDRTELISTVATTITAGRHEAH